MSSILPTNYYETYLQGGGEMGELTRNFNWSTSSIGTPQHWPQSLLITLNIILNSKFPMLLCWGEDLIQFYNDAYRPSLGNEGKHPKALGQSARECWPEIWDIIYPLIQQVQTTGEATWREDQLLPIYRNGKIEDVYWTYSHSPVIGEKGERAGVLVTCVETTEKVLATKKIQESEERFRQLADNAPMWVWMADEHASLIYTNKELLKFVGFNDYKEFTANAWEKVIHPNDIQMVYEIFGNAYAKQEAYSFECRFINAATGKYEWVMFKGAPRAEAKKYSGFIGTGMNIDKEKKHSDLLEQNSQKFRKLLEALPQMTWTNLPNGDVNFYNQQWYAYTGLDFEQTKEWGWKAVIHPDDLTNTLKEYTQALQTGELYVAENRCKHHDGSYRWHLNRALPIKNESGDITLWVGTATDIHDLKLAESALKESEQNLRNIILQAPVAMCILKGPQHVVEIANERMFELWGKPSEAMINLPIFEGLPEVKNQGFEDLLDTVYKTGETFSANGVPLSVPRKGKIENIFINFVYEAYREANGIISGVMAVATEVTEQISASKKIERSEQRIRSIIESAPFPIGVYTGREMQIEFVNQAIVDVWGKGKEVVGKLYADVLPELTNQQIYEQLDTVYTTGIPFQAKNQRVDLIVGDKLQSFYFNYSFTPLYDGSGKVYGVMNTAADVTDLNVARQKLQESEENLRKIILRAPVAMCIFTGPEFIVETANESMLELWGKTAEEVINKPIFEGNPEGRGQGYEQILENIITTGERFSIDEMPATLLRKEKLEKLFVNLVCEPIKEHDGRVSGILVVAVEVTEQVLARRKIEEVVNQRTKELAEANQLLQQSNVELNQFAYIASHDLQEPLRKVRTFTQMMQLSLGEVSEKTQTYINKIQGSIERMQTLINDVLKFSLLSKEREKFERVDLNNVLTNILGDYELLIDQKGATVTSNTLPVVEAIFIQMSQLFTNLISNALKFSANERPLEVTILAKKLSKQDLENYKDLNPEVTHYQIEFKDNGIGFNQEHAQQIFTIFQRLHGKMEYEGTGIGLAMCKKIMMNHQGVIYAVSTLNEGATFTVILPQEQTLKNKVLNT